MARIELDKGSNPEFKTLADNIISAQEREIKQMSAHDKGAAGGTKDTDAGHRSG